MENQTGSEGQGRSGNKGHGKDNVNPGVDHISASTEIERERDGPAMLGAKGQYPRFTQTAAPSPRHDNNYPTK